MDDRKRLDLIASALAVCGQDVTPEAVASQFRYETGRDPDGADVERAILAVARRTEAL